VPIAIIVLYGTGYSLLVSSLRAVWRLTACFLSAAVGRVHRSQAGARTSDRCGRTRADGSMREEHKTPSRRGRPTVLFSFPCVPLVITNPSQLGTAFGIIFALQNTGLVPPAPPTGRAPPSVAEGARLLR
jgi:hypothetical protein